MTTALTALAASFVWGTAFAFQRMAAGHIGAITFNFYRSVLAALSLGVLLFVSNRRKKPEERKKSDPKKIAIGGAVCGVSAAIAISGAVGGRKQDAPVTITIVVVWAIIMIFLLPLVSRALGLHAGVAGAWIGTSEFADAAGFAAAQETRRQRVRLPDRRVTREIENLGLHHERPRAGERGQAGQPDAELLAALVAALPHHRAVDAVLVAHCHRLQFPWSSVRSGSMLPSDRTNLPKTDDTDLHRVASPRRTRPRPARAITRR